MCRPPQDDDEGLSQIARQRKRVEMRFAHLKNHYGFERLRLRGLSGARDEFPSRSDCAEPQDPDSAPHPATRQSPLARELRRVGWWRVRQAEVRIGQDRENLTSPQLAHQKRRQANGSFSRLFRQHRSRLTVNLSNVVRLSLLFKAEATDICRRLGLGHPEELPIMCVLASCQLFPRCSCGRLTWGG